MIDSLAYIKLLGRKKWARCNGMVSVHTMFPPKYSTMWALQFLRVVVGRTSQVLVLCTRKRRGHCFTTDREFSRSLSSNAVQNESLIRLSSISEIRRIGVVW